MILLLAVLQADILQKHVSLFYENKKIASLIKGTPVGSASFNEYLQVSTIISKDKYTKKSNGQLVRDNGKLEKDKIIYNDKRKAIGMASINMDLIPINRDLSKDENHPYNYYKLDGLLKVKSEEASTIFKAEDTVWMMMSNLLKQGKNKYTDFEKFISKFKLQPFYEGEPSFTAYSYTYDWHVYEDEVNLILLFSPDSRLLAVYNFASLDKNLRFVSVKPSGDSVIIKGITPKYKIIDGMAEIVNKDLDLESVILHLVNFNEKSPSDVKALNIFTNVLIGNL